MNINKENKEEGFQEKKDVIPPEKHTVVPTVPVQSAQTVPQTVQTLPAPSVQTVLQTVPQTVQTVQTPLLETPALDSIQQVLANITSQLNVLTKESQDRRRWETKPNQTK